MTKLNVFVPSLGNYCITKFEDALVNGSFVPLTRGFLMKEIFVTNRNLEN